MKTQAKWTRVVYIIGVILLIIGAIDPLEGSVLILIGSAFLALSTYLARDRHYKIFMSAAIMNIVGVFFLFYFSSLGGFGGTSTLSWWWALLVIVYPIGWLMTIVLLIVRAFQKKRLHINA